jgi:hypothetical protein
MKQDTNRNLNLLYGDSKTIEDDTDHKTFTAKQIVLEKKKYTAKDKRLSKYIWGLGLEHESHLFHFNMWHGYDKTGNMIPMKDVIVFDTLNSTVDLVEYSDLNAIEKNFLESIPFEPTGRKCHGKFVLKKTPISMPEFITQNPFTSINTGKKTVELFYKELLDYETRYVVLQKRNMNTKNKIDKYGELRQFPFGMSSYIKMAKNYLENSYQFDKKLLVDYLGSFHVTITLPFTSKKTYTTDEENEFRQRHENFANQFQWIEPLLLSAFFSCDQKAVGSVAKRVRGSFRVMRVGWGNFAGTDVSHFDKGAGRYATIPSYWRENLNFYEISKLKPCYQPKQLKGEPDAVSLLSGNLRTFGSTDPERPWHRVSGAPMNIPNGIEIRIFDNFETIFLISLLRLIILLAANSTTIHSTKYVYQNKSWIKSIHNIMEYGWRAEIPKTYILELEKMLGLRLNKNVNNAYELLVNLTNALWEKNKDSDYVYMMCEKYKNAPTIPNINRNSWEYALLFKLSNSKTLHNKFIKMVEELPKKLSVEEFKRYYSRIFSGKGWETNTLDVLYFLETRKIVKLIYSKGIPKNIIVNSSNFIVLKYLTSREISSDLGGFPLYRSLSAMLKSIKNQTNNTSPEYMYFKILQERLKEKYEQYSKTYGYIINDPYS